MLASKLHEQVAEVVWHEDWAYAEDLPVSAEALRLAKLMLDRVPDGWARVGGEWWRAQAVEVEHGDDGETVTMYALKDGCI